MQKINNLLHTPIKLIGDFIWFFKQMEEDEEEGLDVEQLLNNLSAQGVENKAEEQMKIVMDLFLNSTTD